MDCHATESQKIYEAVFRQNLQAPGFFFKDFGASIRAEVLRHYMLELAMGLSQHCLKNLHPPLYVQRFGRFHQSCTSQFHRDHTDNARSFLIMGYEPTPINSRILVADYSRFAADRHMSCEHYLAQREEDAAGWDALLAPYTTECTFSKFHYRLVVVNNSQRLGLFHRAHIKTPSTVQNRMINYLLLSPDKDATVINFWELGTHRSLEQRRFIAGSPISGHEQHARRVFF